MAKVFEEGKSSRFVICETPEKISEMCNASREPIFITKNGYGDMVIMSIAVFEERMAQLEMREKILSGKAQADAGEMTDGPEAMAAIGKRHGISV